MRPPHLYNDVDASVLSVIKRILAEVPDLHSVLSETLVGLLSGAIDSVAAHEKLFLGRLGCASTTALFHELLTLMNYFCPVIKEKPGNGHSDRGYWDDQCRTCIADITQFLDRLHETSTSDH